ncbi:MAG: hypothetical protein R2932_11335 [Caldilineaceae bacterium]
MINPEHYTYRVIWSERGQCLWVSVEFPSLSWLAESQHDALNGIVELIRSVVIDMGEEGEPIPEPISHRRYSGKFQVFHQSSIV